MRIPEQSYFPSSASGNILLGAVYASIGVPGITEGGHDDTKVAIMDIVTGQEYFQMPVSRAIGCVAVAMGAGFIGRGIRRLREEAETSSE